MGLNLDKIQKNVNPSFTFENIGDILESLLPIIYLFAGVGLLIYLIMGGLGLMTSGGDPKAVEAAKGKVTNALIGFIIVIASFWIIQIVGRFLGLEIFIKIFG